MYHSPPPPPPSLPSSPPFPSSLPSYSSLPTCRLLCLSLSLVQHQHSMMQRGGMDLSSLQEELACLAGLAQGDKGVVWADQTRIISTNDLRDVSTSDLSATQQELFDCFLEHSSPYLNKKTGGGPFFPHLGILTQAHANKYNSVSDVRFMERTASGCGRGSGCDAHHAQGVDLEGSTTPTPSSQYSGTSAGTVTLQAGRTLTSAQLPPHCITSLPSSTTSSSSSLATPSDGLMNDGCFSSHRPPPSLSRSPSLSSCFSEGDALSQVSSSAFSSCLNSDPIQDPDEVDYSRLSNRSVRSHDLAEMTLPSSASHLQWHKTQACATPTNRILFQRKLVGTPYFPHSETTPTVRELNTRSAPPMRRDLTTPTRVDLTPPARSEVNTPTRRESVTPTPVPQPYSMFQPLQPPPRSRKATPTSLSSQQSISADSGLGSINGGTGCTLRRTPLLPPHRPNANGFMVRSSASTLAAAAGNGSSSSAYCNPARCSSGFEDNFTSPPPPPSLTLSRQEQNTGHMTCQSAPNLTHQSALHSGAALPVKPRLGAFTSPFHKQFPVRAMLNPYVRDPAHMSRPLVGALASGSNNSGHTPQHTTPIKPLPSLLKPTTTYSPVRGCGQVGSGLVRPRTKMSEHKALVKHMSIPVILGSMSSMSGVGVAKDDHALNSTFTVAGGSGRQTAKPSLSLISNPGGTSEDVPKGQGRGMFSRGKTTSKIPSYLRTTKSTESKKVSR